jgi:FAD synthetase
MAKVMVFGTFDLVHPGHVHFLEQAKKHGNELVVVIARDSTVEKTKRRKPSFSENDRRQMVQALRVVDRAVLGYEGDVYRIVREEKPDVICLGYDQNFFVDKLEAKLAEFGLKTKVIRLQPHAPETYKSSKIRAALATGAAR